MQLSSIHMLGCNVPELAICLSNFSGMCVIVQTSAHIFYHYEMLTEFYCGPQLEVAEEVGNHRTESVY